MRRGLGAEDYERVVRRESRAESLRFLMETLMVYPPNSK